MYCTRNGQRTIQLPKLGPGPAGPETHLENQTKDEVIGLALNYEMLLYLARLFFVDINLPSVDIGISHPFFVATLKSTSLTSFWKLWVSLIGAYMTALCAAMSCQQASWMTVTSWTTMNMRPDHFLKRKTTEN